MNFINKKINKFKLFIKNKIEKPLLYKYPLFISYPRSGAHWINSLMELYFDRPRLRRARPTFLDRKRKDWMWISDHDLDLKIVKNIGKKKPRGKKILFLYRNPLDVLYSHLNAVYRNFEGYGYMGIKNKEKDYIFSRESVVKETLNWINYHEKHINLLKSIKLTFISYDSFKNPKKRNNEFNKICNHFSKPFIKKRFESIFERYGKIDLDKNKLVNKEIYLKEKEKFVEKWGDTINKMTKDIRNKLNSLL